MLSPHTALSSIRGPGWRHTLRPLGKEGASKAQGDEDPARETKLPAREAMTQRAESWGVLRRRGVWAPVGGCSGTWGLATGQENWKPGYRGFLFEEKLGSSGVRADFQVKEKLLLRQ